MFLKKLNIEWLYDPAIPLLDIYSKKMKTVIQKDICTPMFIAALFTVVKTCIHVYTNIYKYIHTMEYYSAIKKE